MSISSDYIRVIQVFLSNYDKTALAIDRMQRCSTILQSIPVTPVSTQLHAETINAINMLKVSKSDAEQIIRHLCFTLCDNSSSTSTAYSCDITTVVNRLHVYLNSLTTSSTSSISSPENTFDQNDPFTMTYTGSYSPSPFFPIPMDEEPTAMDPWDDFNLNDPTFSTSIDSSDPQQPNIALPQMSVTPGNSMMFQPSFLNSLSSTIKDESNLPNPLSAATVDSMNPTRNEQSIPTNYQASMTVPSTHSYNTVIRPQVQQTITSLKEQKSPVTPSILTFGQRRIKHEDDEDYEGDTLSDESPSKRRRDKIKKEKDRDDKRCHNKPKWCHQCKARKRDVIQCCGEGKPRGANNQICFRAYCAKCLKKHYNEDYNEIKRSGKKWLCPGCRDVCSCAACVRKRYADPRDIPESLQEKRNSRFFKTNKKIIQELSSIQ